MIVPCSWCADPSEPGEALCERCAEELYLELELRVKDELAMKAEEVAAVIERG